MYNKTCALLILGLLAGNLFSAETPGWLKGLKVKGDLRLRVEGKDSDNAVKNRNRARFRLRLAVDKQISDSLAVGIRLASGSGDPTSTNQTFDSSFSGKDFVLDRAYLTYKTEGGWELGGGKVKNPFHSSDIVWDTDVNPEGFYQRYTSEGGFYVTLGEMVVEEEKTGNDVNLYAGQVGYKTGERAKWNMSAAWYSYDNLLQSDTSSSKYQFIDLLASVKMQRVKLTFDYVKNTSSDIDDQDTAWSVYADFGSAKKPGDWTFQVKYAEIEATSVWGPLADSDFGFTDKEGFVGRVGYKANKHVSWNASAFGIDGIQDTDSGFNYLQMDCAVKF